MSRPKGSKNKAKTVAAAVNTDPFAAQINAKNAEINGAADEIKFISAGIEEQKKLLKQKKSELKKLNAALARIEQVKAAQEAAANEAARKAQAEQLAGVLLASGKSMEEIAALLNSTNS